MDNALTLGHYETHNRGIVSSFKPTMSTTELLSIVAVYVVQLEVMIHYQVEPKCAAFFLLGVTSLEYGIFKLFQYILT